MQLGSSNEVLPGWEAPVFRAMHALPTFWGVPQIFGVMNFLGTLFLFLLWWPGILLGVLAHGIACVGTAWEPYWLTILLDYVAYHAHYEA